MGQLFYHSSKSKEDLSALKARLNDLAHSFCGFPIDLTDFTMHVVIFNKSDYMTKMYSILDDASKFENLGSVEENATL